MCRLSSAGPWPAVVATLRRMQWTILEHDPFLWCMHDGRIVDPRRVCPHSMHILFKQAARAWQWRRVALHEGYEGFDRGAVLAPCSPRCTAHGKVRRNKPTCGRWLLTGSGPYFASIARPDRSRRCVCSVAVKKAA